MLLKELSYTHQGIIYLIKNVEILLQFKITVLYLNIFYKLMAKLNFQQSLLQSLVSHDPSEMLIWCSKSISCHQYFFQDSSNRKFKRTVFS